jgi:hypothetical protein
MSDVQSFLNDNRGGGKYPDAKFEVVGDRASGTIVSTPKVVETQYGRRLLVDLDDGQGGGVTLWIKEGPMAQAVAEAAGSHGLVAGGVLTLTFASEKDTGKSNPVKLFEATYTPPQTKVDVGSIFGDS